MKYVVIGGGGFIGSHITEALLQVGENVTIFDKSDARYLEELSKCGAKIFTGNFLDANDLENVLSDADVVFHLASTTVPKTSNENPIFDIETNLIGTVNLLTIAKNVGVHRIIFPSSGGTVYGIPVEIPIRENHPTNPICSYGIVKLAIEKYARLFWELHGLDYRILRISNAYGERQPMNPSQGVIPMIIGNALQNKKINIWGNGSIIRDYIHVSDVADAFLKVSLCSEDQRIYNIGSGLGLSLNNILQIVEELLGKPLDIEYQRKQVYDVPENILDVSIAKEFLKWQAKIGINEGLFRTINYMRKQINHKLINI